MTQAPVLDRPAVVRTDTATSERSVGLLWWVLTALLLFCAVYFHSKIDPGDRFQIKAGNDNYGPSWFQDKKFGQLTPADLAILAFVYLALMNRLAHGWLETSRRATRVTVAVTIVIVLGVAVGLENGTKSPFGDWRDLLMGALFAFGLWSTVLRTEEGCFQFARLFVAIVSAYGALQLFEYMAGGGEIAFYGRTPTGDHATLEYMVACVGFSLAMLRTGRSRSVFLFGALVGTAVVVLGFRRYAWIELGIVYGVFVLLSDRQSRRQYVKGLFAVAAATGVAVALTWSQLQWSERLASVNPWTSKQENSYSRTNQGHMDDILDGLDQVRAHPVLGLGVGVTYVGTRTARWKGEAGMVHNGPIEIWIKFGIIGVLTYITLYMWLFASVWKRRRGTRYSDLLAWGGGAFLFGNFLVNFTVYSWPFNVWEKSVLIFAVFAVAFPHRAKEPAGGREAVRS